jgi:hypothetical protein
MTNKYKVDFSDTEHAHVRKPSDYNYYVGNYENGATFAVDVTVNNGSEGSFFIVYLGQEHEYSPVILLDNNEIRDFKSAVSISPQITLGRMIALHDEKVKTVRLVVWNDDERTLLDFNRRLAETYLTICKDFTNSELTYEKVREAMQSIIDTDHYRFTSDSEVNLTPHNEESLTYLLTDKMLVKFRELRYK